MTVLSKWMGWPNLVDMAAPIRREIDRELERSAPDAQGNFFEKYLAEMQAQAGNPKSSFNKEEGIKHLLASAQDLFLAGTINSE